MTTALVRPWWVPRSAEQGWLMACMAPRPFWKATAPIDEAASMKARASTLRPSSTATGSHSLHKPHGFQRDALAERVEERAAPRFQRMGQRVHAGPRRDVGGQADGQLGIGDDDARQHLRVEDDLLGVVGGIGDDGGAADLGAGAGGGRHRDDRRDAVGVGAQSTSDSRSSKSNTGRVCPAMKAMSLPMSMPEPPPKAMTPSWSPARYAARPSSRFFSVGLPSTLEKTA